MRPGTKMGCCGKLNRSSPSLDKRLMKWRKILTEGDHQLVRPVFQFEWLLAACPTAALADV